jgi:hypothetical protein
MAGRYKVTVEEDDGMGAVTWIIGAVLVVACFFFIGIPLLVGYIIYLIYKYNKKQKALAPTICAHCKKKNALVFFKTEIIKEIPVVKTVYSKDKNRLQDRVTIMEYTYRTYEKCKFCDSISFSDTIKSSKE